MKKLTANQLLDIQNLVDNPLIEMASIDFHANGLMRVTVVSCLNAEWNPVDAILEEIFPGMEYRGPSVHVKNNEMYSIGYNGVTLINLVMKKTPTSIEATREILHPDCMINVTKVQSLLEPWYVEQILKDKENGQ